jgi:hypothetical protein
VSAVKDTYQATAAAAHGVSCNKSAAATESLLNGEDASITGDNRHMYVPNDMLAAQQ